MKKTSNGWSMVGICSQWAIDERLSNNQLAVYLTIVRNSFGYKRRYCYLKYSEFVLSNRNTIKKTLDDLIQLGYISCKHTTNPKTGHRGKNEYRILEPKNFISNFVFDTKDIKKKDYTIEEERWDE